MIKHWFYDKTGHYYVCHPCVDKTGMHYAKKVPCHSCGVYTVRVDTFRRKQWTERALDILCIFLLPLLPIAFYYTIVESYFNGGHIKKL